MLPAGGALILAVASAMHHATANCVRGFPALVMSQLPVSPASAERRAAGVAQ